MEHLSDWKSILFVEVRFHPNQHPIVEELLERGHEVEFLSLRKQKAETYSSLHPDFVRYSALFRLFYSLLRGKRSSEQIHETSDTFVHKYGVPKLGWYYRYLSRADPDLIVLKGYNVITYCTILIANRIGADLLFYDQDPVYGSLEQSKSRSIAVRLQETVCRKPFVRFSPVRGEETGAKAHENAYYLPFVARPDPAARSRSYVPDGTVRVLMIGKFTSPRKNHKQLVRIMEDLDKFYDVQLTLIGQLENPDHEYFTTLRQLVSKSDMDERIDVRPNLSYEEVQEAYLEHDLYVLPSERERAAVSHLEAMAHGLPVICSETNGTSCYVEPGGNGYLVTPGDDQALREKIELLLEESTIQEFGARSYELAESTYSGQAFYKRFENMIRENF
jgi:glycosyltransferase involved in cell wall biosynthesis